ncbi:MAG: urea transport system substrate-binding protein [Solirubrobacteraceae bacterium]|nr:urea transport system substrate-binding protein [Solirubrobacteraceae bacterium]
MDSYSRRRLLSAGGRGLVGLTVGGGLLAACGGGGDDAGGGGGGGGGGGADSGSGPIKVGLLNALSGGLSIIEQSIHNAALLAIEEVNAAGGVNGRKIQAISEDYASDFSVVVQKAQKLIQQDKVAAVFGCYTSASRVSAVPVFERNDALLFYSTFYEGLECSPNVFYVAAVPTQQLFDFVPWVVKNLGKRVFIVGSDYLYPRTMSTIEKLLIEENGGAVVDDRYFPLGTTEFASVIASFSDKKPDVVLSNMVGDSIPAFYKQFRSAGFTADRLPIAATVTTEQEVQAMGPQDAAGHYMSATYFQSLENAANENFVKAYKAKFGADEVTNMPMVGMYDAVHLFAEAAKGLEKIDTQSLAKAMVGTTFADAPEGIPVEVLPNHHISLPSLVGKADAKGQYQVVENFGARKPDPFPAAIVPKGKIPSCPTPFKETSRA